MCYLVSSGFGVIMSQRITRCIMIHKQTTNHNHNGYDESYLIDDHNFYKDNHYRDNQLVLQLLQNGSKKQESHEGLYQKVVSAYHGSITVRGNTSTETGT